MADWIVNIDNVEEEHQQWSWQTSNYDRYRKHISVALGNTEGHHPFDLELTRLAPGQKPCPIHAHSHRWEFFIIVSGKALVNQNGEETEAVAGDCFMQPAGTKHRIQNGSDTKDLIYYIIATEHEEDSVERVEV